MVNSKEIWKDIQGYEGLYQISNFGHVRSLKRFAKSKSHSKRTVNPRLLKGGLDVDGYHLVSLYKKGKKKTFKVHRLVAKAFIPNPNRYSQVNHKDENKHNNCVNNLEWCNCKYNINYGTGISRRNFSNTNGKHSKLVGQFNLNGKLIKRWPSAAEAGRHGFNANHIRECARGVLKTSRGFIWKYIKKDAD